MDGYGTSGAGGLLSAALADAWFERKRRQKYPNVIGYGNNCEVAYYNIANFGAALECAKAGDKKAMRAHVEVLPVTKGMYRAVCEILLAKEAAKAVAKNDRKGFDDLVVKARFAEGGSAKLAALWSSATSKLEKVRAEHANASSAAPPGPANNVQVLGIAAVVGSVANDVLYQAGREVVIFYDSRMEAKWRRRSLNLEHERDTQSAS